MFEEKAEISLISGIYRVSGFIGWNSSTASVVDPSVFGAPELGASIRQYSHSRVSAGNSFQDPLWHQNLRGLRPLRVHPVDRDLWIPHPRIQPTTGVGVFHLQLVELAGAELMDPKGQLCSARPIVASLCLLPVSPEVPIQTK